MGKKRQFLIIGLGGFGFALAKAISKRGGVVFAVDKEERLVEEIKDFVEVAARLDATDYKALKSFGVENIDVGIVCIGAVEENLLATILLKKLGVPKIFSRAVSPLQKEILKALEVTRIIEVEQEFADAFALSLVERDVFKQISLSEGYSVVELKVPEAFIGKKLKELDLRKRYKVNVVAIKRKEPQIDEGGRREIVERLDPVPDPEIKFREDDICLLYTSPSPRD